MKHRIFGSITVIVVMAVSLIASSLPVENTAGRIHQHLEASRQNECCSCDGAELCTHLPLVLVETDAAEIPGVPIVDEAGNITGYTKTQEGEKMLSASIQIVDNEDANNHPSDEPALSTSALIRIRGNASRLYDKKSYLLRFTGEDGSYANYAVMGMDAHYEWALYGPYLDKTLIRNYMWYNIAGECMDYAPNVRFCEVILNGEYQGLYVMTETITSGKDSRLNLTEPVAGAAGYVIRLDNGSDNALKNIETFSMYVLENRQIFDIEYPHFADLTQALADAIAQDVSDFEKTLYSYDYDTDDYGYWHDLDADSFAYYFIINEFTMNYDAGYLSTYIYRDVGERYKIAVWDFDSACNNYEYDLLAEEQNLKMQYAPWFFMLTKDEYFTNKVIEKYYALRKSYLSDEYLENYIDETVEYLGDAVDRNFEVWGYTFDMDLIQPSARNPKSYREAVAQMKAFLRERGAWLDENIEIIRQYSHESKVKNYNH